MDINDLKGKFEELKKKLIKEGSKPGAEEEVKKNFWQYFRKHEGNISFAEQIEKIYDLMTSGSLSTTDKALIIGALVYFINPFDLVPDVIPFVGFVDDMTVIALVYRYLTNRAFEENPKNPADEKDDSES
jgi:uncharacterized membrane protein YkvA (DUF1232 family)